MKGYLQNSHNLTFKFKLFFICIIYSLGSSQISYAEEIDSQSTQTQKHSEVTTEADDQDSVDNVQEEPPAVAPNVDLKEVAPPPEPIAVTSDKLDKKSEKDEVEETSKPRDETDVVEEDPVAKATTTTKKEQPTRKKLIILGSEVPEATSTRLAWSPQVTISGLALPTPVLVINGANPGPTVCLTGATHGDELNGIEVVRRVMYDISPKKLNGTIIGVPIVNLQGFQRGSRYLSDRRDLNRYFPGDPNGSLASRIAYSLFTEVIKHCDYLIDLHTGSFRRTNLAQIRANMNNPKVTKFVEGFDKIAVVHHPGNLGMLRTAANLAGITAITMELGESLRIQENQIVAGTYAVNSLLDKLEMYPRVFIWGDPKPAYYASKWLRVESGGILFSEMGLGDDVTNGDILGVVTDPITNQKTELISPFDGHIIGMAVDQVVVPGFAAYHIGIKSTQEEMAHTDQDSELMDMDVDVDGEVDPE